MSKEGTWRSHALARQMPQANPRQGCNPLTWQRQMPWSPCQCQFCRKLGFKRTWERQWNSTFQAWMLHNLCRLPNTVEVTASNRNCSLQLWERVHGSLIFTSWCNTDHEYVKRDEGKGFPYPYSQSSCTLQSVRRWFRSFGDSQSSQVPTKNKTSECKITPLQITCRYWSDHHTWGIYSWPKGWLPN